MKNLTVIIVCYNSGKLLVDSSWRAILDDSRINAIFIDNKSQDESSILLKSSYPHHRLLQMGYNSGYGRALNAAFRECQTQFALILNPDLLIDLKSIKDLLNFAMLDSDETVMWGPALNHNDYRQIEPINVEHISGAAMLVDLQRLKKMDLANGSEIFDENIFLFSEETDLCYRIRKETGLIKQCPSIIFKHLSGHSSGDSVFITKLKSYHFAWSRCYYLQKHCLFTKKRNPHRMLIDYSIKRFISLSKTKRISYQAKRDGVRDFLKGLPAFSDDNTARYIKYQE